MKLIAIIENCDGRIADVPLPENWLDMSPVSKALAIHETARNITKGRPFRIMGVERS